MSASPFDLTGRTALITGSSQGLGLATARGLAQAGATVILNGRDKERLHSAVEVLSSEGLQAVASSFDVTDSVQINRALSELAEQVPQIDILINNAGIHRRAPLVDMSEEDWRAVLDTNLTSAFLVSRAIVPAMIARRSGKIINICSLMSDVARPTTGNYAAAKGGLKMLTRAMAVEWSQYNIQTNGIGPGYFATDLTRPLVENAEFNSWICRRTPAGRWGRPEELVGTAVFFASSASDFVSGQCLYVDGGLLAAI